MDAPVVFTEAQADTDDYLLDLDADPGAEDFDFKLDGVYDTGTVDTLIETSGEVGADAGPDLEIRGEDEETHAAVAKEEYSGANEEAQDGGVDASIEYQDEIGYEDDESALPDAANTGTEETSAPHPEQSATNYEGVRDQQDVSGHQEGAYESEQGVPDQNKELDAHDGSFQQEDAHGQDEDHGLQENDVGGTSALESTDASTHQSLLDHGRTPASNPDDFENADSDASDNSSMLLDIVVHYNQGQYALVGDPADDPDTYFFSDENVLTGPLSHFLASIRTVLSDEVSPGDELSIRVESLDFEFGEKSSKKFLDRPFYDIVKCFAGLAENSKLPSKDSSTLNLALMVRRDCEDHFCELLTEAGLAGHEGDEGVDDASSGDQAHDESSADEVPGGYDLDPEAAGAADEDEDDAERNEDEVEMYFAEAFEDLDDTMGDPFDLEMGVPGPTEQPGAEASDEQNTEAPRDEDPQEGHGGADDIDHEERAAAADGLGDDDVDFSADFEGEFAADPTKEESELAGDAPDQAVEAVNNDWYEEAGTGEDVGVEEVNAANPAGATTEQGLPQNVSDVDFGFTLDPESGLSTTLDEHGDVGTALEVDLGHASTNSSHLVANVSNGLGSASNHTSRTSTIIGDEVETQGSSLLHSAFSDVQHGTESQGDRDEIDWENDGEENEEQPQLAQTTNTPSAKRTRTNEPESLDEEADYKRRRT